MNGFMVDGKGTEEDCFVQATRTSGGLRGSLYLFFSPHVFDTYAVGAPDWPDAWY